MNNYPIGIAVGMSLDKQTSNESIFIAMGICIVIIGIIIYRIYKD